MQVAKHDSKQEAPDASSSEAASLYKKQDLSLKQGETLKCGCSCPMASSVPPVWCPHVCCLCYSCSCLVMCMRGVRMSAALLCHCSYSSAHCRINMKRTSGDKSGASTGGFLANLSGEQQSAGKPALISLAPPPPPQVRHWHLGSLHPADSSYL